MKKKIRNCLATTGIALVLLATTAFLYQARFLCIETVFQVFGACICIHLGLALLESFESKYCSLEILAEIGIVLTILVIAGFIFGWYTSMPVWVLLLMGIAVYAIGCMIDMFKIQSDINVINEYLLQNNRCNSDGEN